MNYTNPLLSAKISTYGNLLKIEWLVAGVTPVRSPARVEGDILGIFLDVVRPIQAAFVVTEPLCDVMERDIFGG